MTEHAVVALVHEDDGVFGISFPDFPGCVSGGNSLEETLDRGQAALAFHVAGMIEDGDTLPRIRSFAELRESPAFEEDAAGGLIAAVPLELPGKAVRVNISMDESLLEQIDRAAQGVGQSRSTFLAEAARARIKERL